MSKEIISPKFILGRYASVSVPITSFEPSFLDRDSEDRKRKHESLHNRRMDRLGSLDIDDSFKRHILAQGISAVYERQTGPGHKRLEDEGFMFIFMTEPEGDRFLIGEMRGKWPEKGRVFKLLGVEILDIRDTLDETRDTMSVIQSLNPGTVKLGSDSFRKALHPTNVVNTRAAE